MNFQPRTEVKELLQAWNRGDRTAEEKLWPIVYAQLKRLAQRELRQEQLSHSLQSGELVNELYVRLADWDKAQWRNRAHFFGMCVREMIRVCRKSSKLLCHNHPKPAANRRGSQQLRRGIHKLPSARHRAEIPS